jgi:glutamine synthetase
MSLNISCKTAKDVLKLIKEEEIKFVSYRYTDPFGQLQHFIAPSHQVNLEVFVDGVPFDGSSVRGWKSINESDMKLIPDPSSAYIDPFSEDLVLCMMCSVFDPITDEPYLRDSRQIAIKATEYLQQSKIGDTAFFGPECEYFLFDKIKYSNGSNHSMYQVDVANAAWNTGNDSEDIHIKDNQANMGYKPPHKGGYFTTSPIDKDHDIRLEMMKTLEAVGLVVERGHSEVATGGQSEINFRFDELLTQGDNVFKYKYVLRNVAHTWGKYLTFLPKPLAGDNGSGMHCHFSIWKDGENLFAGEEYADLSETALFAIGGIIKHGRAISAFSNPTLNSYHRLVPGFEAPVTLAYSQRNRSAAIRIPITKPGKAKRIECRFPDSSSNPYLTFSAILCAAIDGIKNKIHPGEATDTDLYELEPEKLAKIPQLPGSLTEALEALKQDMDFLTEGGVFTKDFINTWIEWKNKEIDSLRLSPHPKEFELYYDI